jgi:hypothetical protein
MKTSQAAKSARKVLAKLKTVLNQPFLDLNPRPNASAAAASSAPLGPRVIDIPRCKNTDGDQVVGTPGDLTANLAIRNVVTPPASTVASSMGGRTSQAPKPTATAETTATYATKRGV